MGRVVTHTPYTARPDPSHRNWFTLMKREGRGQWGLDENPPPNPPPHPPGLSARVVV